MRVRTRRHDEDERGFTLTELLVVIVIIGILAAVAIPLYINQQARARDAAAQSDVSGLGREIQAQLVHVGVSNIQVGLNASGSNYVLRITQADGSTVEEGLGGVSNTVRLVGESGAPLAPGTFTPLMVQPRVSGDGSDTDFSPDLSERTWCINVHVPGGKEKSQRYSASRGLKPGLCARAGTENPVTYTG